MTIDTGMHRTKHSPRLDMAIKFPKVGRTKSEFKESCDINYIMHKYLKTRVVPVMTKTPIYGDFSEPFDYMTAQNALIAANDNFESLPADVRKKFDNDPAKFLEFATNPDNQDEMIKMGLLPEPPKTTAEPKVEAEPDASAAGEPVATTSTDV